MGNKNSCFNTKNDPNNGLVPDGRKSSIRSKRAGSKKELTSLMDTAGDDNSNSRKPSM